MNALLPLLVWLLSQLVEQGWTARLCKDGCQDSVVVLGPGDAALCPPGSLGILSVAGENVALHCSCPK